MIDLRTDPAGLARARDRVRESGLLLPTLAQLQNPDLIPGAVKERLRTAGPSDPVNLFRLSWYAEGTGFRTEPNYVELSPALTGVPCRILVLTGGAAETGAAYGALLPRLVTGQLDAAPVRFPGEAGERVAALLGAPAAERTLDPAEEEGCALWHCSVTGPALADLFAAARRPGERFAAVCLAAEAPGLTAAGDLLKERFPRLRLAASRVGGPDADWRAPWTCNVKNLDLTVRATEEDCLRLRRLFGTEAGQAYCRTLGLTEPERAALARLGSADLAAVLGCIRLARYFELTAEDVAITVAAAPAEPARAPGYDAAAQDHAWLTTQGTDGLLELRYPDRRCLHAAKAPGHTPEALAALWRGETWDALYHQAPALDRLVNECSDAICG